MEIKNKLKKEYSENCPVCGYKVIGTSESQVKYNIKVHAMQKHNLMINIKQLPKNQTMKEVKEHVRFNK